MPMTRPDDEEKPFGLRWNTLVRVLLIDPSVKLVARTAMDHADLFDGTDVHISNERMARVTLYSERTVRTAWETLRALGMAERVSTGGMTASGKRKTDEHDLIIPGGWKSLAILGPYEGRFHCVQCAKVFNPSTSALVVRANGTVGWFVYKMVFCPDPKRRANGKVPESCFVLWSKKRKRNGSKSWDDLGNEGAWKLFREARGDEW